MGFESSYQLEGQGRSAKMEGNPLRVAPLNFYRLTDTQKIGSTVKEHKLSGRNPLAPKQDIIKIVDENALFSGKTMTGAEHNYSLKRKRAAVDWSAVINKAKEIESNLPLETPSVIKHLFPSHVSGGFCLGLPKRFCSIHMPKSDSVITLEDELGVESKTKFLVEKTGLSAGWRGFSIAHNLADGDAVVFQLVQPTRFKVYIVRSNGSKEVDGALGLLQLDSCRKQRTDAIENRKREPKEPLETLLIEMVQENSQDKDQSAPVTKMDHLENEMDPAKTEFDPSEDESDEQTSGIVNGIQLSKTVIEFKQVKGIQDFLVQVNGLDINSKLSKHTLAKYYELCRSQSSFLHSGLIKGLNWRLVTGMIEELINISDAIRSPKLFTSSKDLLALDRTLLAFEGLGMNTALLRPQLNCVLRPRLMSERSKETKVTEQSIRDIEEALRKIKQELNRRNVQISY